MSREPAFVDLNTELLTDAFQAEEIDFCALDASSDRLSVLKESDIDHRRAPWSTFKIPNLIIALERGIVAGLHDRRVWDRQLRPAAAHWPTAWRQDQSLATAFKRSAVWFFQDIALGVGAERYRAELQKFGYGNASVPENSDEFWLGGPIAISPREQVQFLMRALTGSLAISDRTRTALREVALTKADGGYALFGKTGSGHVEDGAFEGWFVGWVERQQALTATFALYIRARSAGPVRSGRRELSEMLLKAAGYLPNQWA